MKLEVFNFNEGEGFLSRKEVANAAGNETNNFINYDAQRAD